MLKKDEKNIEFLVVGESSDNAEIISNSLRNRGNRTNYTLCSNKNILKKTIAESEHIDFILSEYGYEEFSTSSVIKTNKRINSNLPVLALLFEENYGLVNGLSDLGIASCIFFNQIKDSASIIIREIKIYREIKEIALLRRKLERAEQQIIELLDTSNIPICIISEGVIVYSNLSFTTIFGLVNSDDIDGNYLLDYIHADSQDYLKKIIRESNTYNRFEDEKQKIFLLKSKNKSIPFDIVINSVMYDDSPAAQISFNKIVEKQKLTSQEYQPSLLPDINSFISKYEKDIEQIQENNAFSFVYIKINNYDLISALLGLKKYQILIKFISDIINKNISTTEHGCQLSNRSFALILNRSNGAAVKKITTDILNIINSEEYSSSDSGKTISIKSSAGIYIINSASETFEFSMQNAEDACDESVAEKTLIKVFNPMKLSADGGEDSHWKSKLIYSLKNDEFFNVYQPIDMIDSEDNEFLYEALIRLKNEASQSGVAMPSEFMSQAAKFNLMVDIDKWVIGNIAKEIKHNVHKEQKFIIKLSREFLSDSIAINHIVSPLRKYNMTASHMIFDINEKVAINNLSQFSPLAQNITKIKAKIMISNFDIMNEKSLNMLDHMPISYVKFGSNIIDLAQGDRMEEISSRIGLIKEKNIKTIVSFIENAGSLSTIYALGIDRIQGNFLCPPKEQREYEFVS